MSPTHVHQLRLLLTRLRDLFQQALLGEWQDQMHKGTRPRERQLLRSERH